MARLQEWSGDVRQRLLTKLANRTFKKDPRFWDRMATVLLRRMVGETPVDPELDHPDS